MKMERSELFVNGGAQRVRAQLFAKFRSEVEREFADRLQAASWFKRILLRSRMRHEIERRVKEKLPSPWSLYHTSQA